MASRIEAGKPFGDIEDTSDQAADPTLDQRPGAGVKQPAGSSTIDPAELLALWGVYETPMQARESLDGVGDSMAATVVRTKLSKTSERTLANRMLRYVGKRAATRYGGRLIPLLGAPISAVQNGGSTKDLGRRALAYYGGGA